MLTASSKTLRALIAHLSPRWVLAVLAVLPILSATALVEYLSYREQQRAIDALAHQVVAETSKRVTQELQAYLQTPLLINRLNLDAVAREQLNLQNTAALETVLSDRLEQFEQVTAILFVSSTGTFRAVKRPLDLQSPSTTQSPDKVLVSLQNSLHQPAKRVEIVKNVATHHDRLWYERALTSIKQGWDPIDYDAVNHPFLTASEPIYDSVTGHLLGVFSVQLQLSYLNKLLHRLDVGESSRVLITDQVGNVISTSIPAPTYPIVTDTKANQPLLPFKLDQSQDALTRSLGQHLRNAPTISTSSDPNQQFKFTHNYELHYVKITPLANSYGLNWQVLIVIPKSQLMGGIKANQQTSVILSFLTIGLTTLLGVFAAKGYATYFTSLASTTVSPSDDLIHSQTSSNPTSEINTLSHTLHQMANQMHQCFNQIQLFLAESPAIQQVMVYPKVEWVTPPHYRGDRKFTPTEDLFRRAFEQAPTGILLLSPAGQIIRANAHFCDLLSYAATDLLGLPLQDITHPGDRKPVLEGLQQMLAGTIDSFQVEKHYITQPGATIPVLLQVTPVRDQNDNVLYFVGHIQDIRDRLRAERQEAEFISIISHELRTPLTSIRGAIGVLSTGIYNNRPDKAQHMMQIALNNSERLVRLVNDILDFERLRSGKVELVMQPCQVPDLMQQAIDSVQAIADQSNINLSLISSATTVLASPDLIIQTLTNLLSNAIKFSCPGSKVWLKTEVYGDDWSSQGISDPLSGSTPIPRTSSYIVTPCVLFSIKDQGRGIPEDKLETIFEQFQQVDISDSYKKGGTGLGLAICKKIVQQHNGKIWVESRLGQGSTFYFTLPLAKKVNNV